MTKRFVRTKENFTCEHCCTKVTGNGYTNHCPKCLWSKHVDVSPGDRAETCSGMMEPVRIEGATPDYVLVHRCERCGIERRNKLSASDDMSAVAAIAKLSA